MALQLHDVRDAEAFVAAIANRSQLELGPDDDADLRQFLLTELWLLSTRYEARGGSFSAWATATLKLRVVDWQRKRFGRRRWKFSGHTYERPRVEVVSYDDELDSDSLGQDFASNGSDLETDWLSPGRGVHAERDRERARDLELLDLGPAG